VLIKPITGSVIAMGFKPIAMKKAAGNLKAISLVVKAKDT